jgi:hypothetical protein
MSSPRLKLLKLRVCSYPNPLRQRGIVFLRFTQCFGKSLADASGCDIPLCFCTLDLPQSGNAQLQKLKPGAICCRLSRGELRTAVVRLNLVAIPIFFLTPQDKPHCDISRLLPRHRVHRGGLTAFALLLRECRIAISNHGVKFARCIIDSSS